VAVISALIPRSGSSTGNPVQRLVQEFLTALGDDTR
jgi:hypothetical protein